MSSAIRGVGTVTIVNVADKTTRTLYRHHGNIGRPRWTPDGNGLLVPLDTLLADRAQVWSIAYPSGRPDASPTTSPTTAVCTSIAPLMAGRWRSSRSPRSSTSSWSIPRPAPPVRSRHGGGLRTMTWGGRHAVLHGRQNIFRRDLQDSMPRQLTTEGTVNLNPSTCGDGSVVYQTFTDDRTAIWRMDADGSNPRIVVGDGNPVSPECSPDSTWIAYVRRSDQQLVAVRAPIGGGTPTELIANLSRDDVHISPDGSLVESIVWDLATMARRCKSSPRPEARLVSRELPPRPANRPGLRTGSRFSTPCRGGAVNVWEQPLTGGPPRQVTSFRMIARSDGFAWSPGGKQLAVIRGRVAIDIVLMSDFK